MFAYFVTDCEFNFWFYLNKSMLFNVRLIHYQ